jgi:hypothetical protein
VWFAALLLLSGCDLVFGIDPPACRIDDPRYEPLPNRSRDSLYRYHSDNLTEVRWQVAEATCESDKAHLAAPDDVEEYNAILVGLASRNINDAWIGVARDAAATEYFLVTGEPPLTTFWAPSQPQVATGPVVRITQDGFVTETVTMPNDYVCECDGTTPRTFDF